MHSSLTWCQKELSEISDAEDLLWSCRDQLGSIGVTCVSYARTDLDGDLEVHTTYPCAWRQHYVKNALHEIDPVVEIGCGRPIMQYWSVAAFGQEHRGFFEISQSFGVPTQGAVVTFAMPTGMSVFSIAVAEDMRDWERVFRQHQSELTCIAMAIHLKTSELSRRAVRVTARERDVLLWAARGKTAWETAQILGLSEGTVNQYMRGILTKIGAANRAQAVARAVELGLLA